MIQIFVRPRLTGKNERYQNYNPLIYFTAVCSNCFYSREFSGSYKEWKIDKRFVDHRLKDIKERHLEKLAESNSVIKSLGEVIDITNYPNESAVLKLHLAIYDEMLNKPVNYLDLGRFYLRIGWLYRDYEDKDNPAARLLNGMIGEISSKLSSFEETYSKSANEYKTMSEKLLSHFDSEELSIKAKESILPYKDDFNRELENLDKDFGSLSDKLGKFKEMLNDYKTYVLESGSITGNGFGGHSKFNDFISEVKQSWSGAVVSEEEALSEAIVHYKKALETHGAIISENQKVQVSYLVAELSRRVDNNEQANRYFNETIKKGQEIIARYHNDKSRTAITRKILELAVEQSKHNKENFQAVSV